MNAYKKYLMTMGMVWAGALAVFIAVFLFIVSPQASEKERLNKEVSQKQAAYRDAEAAAKEETKKKLAAELETLRGRLNDYAVDSEDSANLTLDISRLAASNQVSSFTIRTNEQRNNQNEMKNLQENKIAISFDSSFYQFATLLNAFERHHPVVFVDSFKITRSSDDSSSNKINMDLSIFVRKRPEG